MPDRYDPSGRPIGRPEPGREPGRDAGSNVGDDAAEAAGVYRTPAGRDDAAFSGRTLAQDMPPRRAPRDADLRRDDRPGIADLLKDLRNEAQTLFRQEVALAKTELGEIVEQTTGNLTRLAAGGIAIALGGLMLLFAIGNFIGAIFEILGVAELAALGIGYAAVGLTIAGIGYAVLNKGLHGFKTQRKSPERTLESLKEDTQWLKNRVK